MKKILILGAGSTGSLVVDNLLSHNNHEIKPDIIISDFDKVEDVNTFNQLYTKDDVGLLKVEALKKHYDTINITTENPKTFLGYDIVINCIDNIEAREKMLELSKETPNILYLEGGTNSSGYVLYNNLKGYDKIDSYHNSIKTLPTDEETTSCGGKLRYKAPANALASAIALMIINNCYQDVIFDTQTLIKGVD